ncbi:PREDICTED: fas apoptotic inhibitory molecule 3 [Chrysochloris asiatica]|uniref:Fas apoptotic inhibitory molecule 3 n=1 Tax=Chrysochloris asiatica TaxID=185453 RepID=A0A9B0WFV3_CHRAS|nr:PREDICTED: fas apoptotic inhibitory molecule 3 [Chrysochloris asiatica]
MNLWIWSLYFLPVSNALKILPKVDLEGELGGSITFTCSLPEKYTRVYLCREMTGSKGCNTIVSSGTFVKKEYQNRVTKKVYPDKNLFLVEMTDLVESDSGEYACGIGMNTDRGKNQQITLSISEYYPFWEEEPAPEPPGWFHRLLHSTTVPIPPWFHMPEDDSPSAFISKVTTRSLRTQTSSVHFPPPDTSNTYHPPISRTSSVAADKPSTLGPTMTVSKTSSREEQVRPQPVSYNHQIRSHRQRTFNREPSGSEEHAFHILIPSILGLMLLALLGMVVKRAIQRRKVLSRRVRRLAVRMRALEASQRTRLSQRPRVSQRQRSQNIYSACPLRARVAEAASSQQEPLSSSGAPEPSAQSLLSEALWSHYPSLKTSCDYVSCCHQPPAKIEDADSDDYINVPSLTRLPSCPPGPRPFYQ